MTRPPPHPAPPPLERLRRSFACGAAALLVFPLVFPLAACRGHASDEDCRTMTEHYLDLALKETPGSAALSAPQAAAVRDVQRGLKRAAPSYRLVEDRAPPPMPGSEVFVCEWRQQHQGLGVLRAFDGRAVI